MIIFFFLSVRINDTVTFLEEGFDEDIEFGYEVSDEGEDNTVDNVSKEIKILFLTFILLIFKHLVAHNFIIIIVSYFLNAMVFETYNFTSNTIPKLFRHKLVNTPVDLVGAFFNRA